MSTDHGKTDIRNRLGDETSLYLRQHADNPVAWQPWDDEALELARESGRPILLSIGYSACHWCHVMAHESFEDEETARVMNKLYVNIKVDREERPDLDKIYQLSHQLLTGRGGGWPLTLFCDPEQQTPFFAGTYFPLKPRYGMPSFRDVLERAREWFDSHQAEMKAQNERLRQAIESLQAAPTPESQEQIAAQGDGADQALVEQAGKDLLARFDRQHGGYGGAPKFPQAPVLELARDLGASSAANADAVRETLDFTLRAMAASGLRDHLDGGFFRYCVDGTWTIPHFEKMLYDNAQLLPLYAEAAARTGDELLAGAAKGIVAWLEQEMLQDNGGFSASIDADADGVEGGFHVWRRDEVRELLGDDDYDRFARAYGLDGPPNFEDEAWHLVRSPNVDDKALERSRRILARAREKRVHPTLDRKQITSWNALAAGGLLSAARAMQQGGWVQPGQRVLDFIRREQWRGDHLLAVHNAGESRFLGYLDDYAFTLQALLESLRTTWRREDLEFALQVADALIARFEDRDHGGFFFSDDAQATPIARSISTQDDAIPAAYGIAVEALQQLAALIGEQRYHEAADRALDRGRAGLERSPMAFATLTRAVLHAHTPVPQVVIAGRSGKAAQAMKQWAESRFSVNCYLLPEPGGDEAQTDGEQPLPGLLAEFKSSEPVTAWVCRGMQCLPPVNTQDDLEELLH